MTKSTIVYTYSKSYWHFKGYDHMLNYCKFVIRQNIEYGSFYIGMTSNPHYRANKHVDSWRGMKKMILLTKIPGEHFGFGAALEDDLIDHYRSFQNNTNKMFINKNGRIFGGGGAGVPRGRDHYYIYLLLDD